MKIIKKSKIEIYVINVARELRIENKMTQAELAYKLGVSEGFIGKIESEKFSSKYNLNHINKLAQIFNCSPKVFFPDNCLI